MIIIADKNGCADSSYHTLVRHINSPIPIVMVSWAEDFIFNDALLEVKEYVLICFCEYGYDWDLTKSGSHIWGKNSENFPRYYNKDWVTFDKWVKENQPKILFKRELLKKDVSSVVRPIDYPAIISPIPIQSEEEFNNRPISACYYFGRSHEDRLRLHSDIWKGATQFGYSVCDNIYYFDGFMQHESGKKYVSMHIPHYQRHPIENIIAITGLSKIGIAPFGAGQKTFRTTEVSANSAMLMWENDLAYSFDWVDGVNCIMCRPGDEVETIEEFTKTNELYPIYLKGVETFDKYRVGRYISEYLEPIINERG